MAEAVEEWNAYMFACCVQYNLAVRIHYSMKVLQMHAGSRSDINDEMAKCVH